MKIYFDIRCNGRKKEKKGFVCRWQKHLQFAKEGRKIRIFSKSISTRKSFKIHKSHIFYPIWIKLETCSFERFFPFFFDKCVFILNLTNLPDKKSLTVISNFSSYIERLFIIRFNAIGSFGCLNAACPHLKL